MFVKGSSSVLEVFWKCPGGVFEVLGGVLEVLVGVVRFRLREG